MLTKAAPVAFCSSPKGKLYLVHLFRDLNGSSSL